MSNVILGTVVSASGDILTVTPDGSTSQVKAVDCCGASAGDRAVLQMHKTQLLAIAVVGGTGGGGVTPADYITEYGTTSGWAWEKWLSGKATCRKRAAVNVTSWAAWGSILEASTPFSGSGNPYPAGLFVDTPSVHAEQVGSDSAYIMGFEYAPNGSASRPPDVSVLRPTSAPAQVYNYDVVAVGRWK